VLRDPTAYVIVEVAFFVFLLIPVWLPMLVFRESGLRDKCRPLLALVPAAWYAVLFFPNFDPHWASAIVGTIAAYLSLAFSARGWRQLINVPLWIALVAATVRGMSIMWERLS
jgi:hypothetical protein